MSENTDIPGIDGLVSAITGEDPGTYFIWPFHKFNAIKFGYYLTFEFTF